MDTEQFEGRKRDHIQYALTSTHQANGLSGLDRIHLEHEALPELNFDEVRLESTCLGTGLKTPFYVAGMTAGHAAAPALNRLLALACAERGWAMGVGSQRRDLEGKGGNNDLKDEWKYLRKEVPSLVLFANIGISQIIAAPIAQLRRLVDELEAQALAVHANALQEVLQPEGTPRFQGCLDALKRVCSEIGVPVILKETGCGFSRPTLTRLASVGIAALDVSGLGGTHWGRIEGSRAAQSEAGWIQAQAARTYANWGEPTADSVLAARQGLSGMEIWASGGVRSGLDAAKLIALGADRIGYAQPALQAAIQGPEQLRKWMELQEYELRVALFCTGSASPKALRGKEKAWRKNPL